MSLAARAERIIASWDARLGRDVAVTLVNALYCYGKGLLAEAECEAWIAKVLDESGDASLCVEFTSFLRAARAPSPAA